MTLRQNLYAGIFLALVFALAGSVGGPSNSIDLSIMQAAAGFRSSLPELAKVAAAITVLGGYPFTLIVAIIASVSLLVRRAWPSALLLFATVLIERLLVEALKNWVGRPRPMAENLPDSLAFPSGHSANSMTTFLSIALIAVPAAYRRTAAIAAIALSVLVGLTRLILGVHWTTDVIGGWAFGLMVVGAAIIVGERSGALPLEAQHDVVGGHLAPPSEDEAA